MKKNSGLTLVELLVIIVIIGMVLTVTSITVTNIMQTTKQNLKEQEVKSLGDGLKSYFQDVIDGGSSYVIKDVSYSGYDFLVGIADTSLCNGSSTTGCRTTKSGNKFSTDLTLLPTTASIKKYIEDEKYNLDSCQMIVSIEYSKNSDGYLELNGINVKKAEHTKASKCVK